MSITGHAGAGEKGNDLVCAGASTLGYTLVTVAKCSEEYHPEIHVTDAEIDVQLHTENVGDMCRALTAMDTVFIGYLMMAAQYPENVNATLIEEEDDDGQSD